MAPPPDQAAPLASHRQGRRIRAKPHHMVKYTKYAAPYGNSRNL